MGGRLLVLVQRGNADADELRARSAWRSSRAGLGAGSWLLLGDTRSQPLPDEAESRTSGFWESARPGVLLAPDAMSRTGLDPSNHARRTARSVVSRAAASGR
jgi:hypothetical protein